MNNNVIKLCKQLTSIHSVAKKSLSYFPEPMYDEKMKMYAIYLDNNITWKDIDNAQQNL